jgi:hypothetical protein
MVTPDAPNADHGHPMGAVATNSRGMTMDASRTQAGWAYKVVKLGPSSSNECEDVLNQLGKDGWDLVSFQPTSTRAYPGEGTYTLKRPL